VKVRFRCPFCQCPGRVDLPALEAPAAGETPQPLTWQCPGCDQRVEIQPPVGQGPPTQCAFCDNHELYKKKSFPHWLGLTILTVACAGFLGFMANFQWGLAWAVLLGSAALDGLLYLWVGDVIVCYRCNAHYHGIEPGPEHKPFELATHERYRQEKLRREELKP
jgi:hypothetical protein